MNLNLRKWATPLTFATFLAVGVTGVLQFFHAGSSLSRVAHEWIGFAVVGAVLFHVMLNWRPFTLYLKRPLAGFIMVMGVVLTIATSVSLTPAGAAPQLNPGMVFGALQRAPISAVAQVGGQDPAELIQRLEQAGYSVSPDQSITQIAAGDDAAARNILSMAFIRE